MTTYNAPGRYRTMNSATQRKLNRITAAGNSKKINQLQDSIPLFLPRKFKI